MLTPRQLAVYRTGWREHKKQKEQQLIRRYRHAMERVRLAAAHLKQYYGCKVILFGSLLREDRFMEHSDIDIAVSGLNNRENFWKLYSEVMDILAPFDFDLVELERIDPEVREYIQKEGMEL
ncbi:Predicted nucleotidyltransferase [Desulfotomaculum arcticum]|uniref:Predicted nucleotidyltransferase n=1 Tax=Desulfotruncus arcticus DSM 17038 TaxID=1121424 RepID=A0A1I2WZJ8_9FIRM|nr:nucleotidyltransferase domain-containing protein [Desulfotruncus arcticus]SFH06718.1 Predicted nucleotidyltransferase [Desulfotomaculum arcticum] [Desulfotruncus arcticus DSM 17038]